MEELGFLNDDVPFNVLSRLPTKTLLGLKCVSKGWHHLISDRSFIVLKSQKAEPVSGFFFQQRFQYCNDDIKTVNYIPVEMEGAEVLQKVFDFLPEDVVILASCNGLVCCRSFFASQDPAIYVCNPTIKKWIRLEWAVPDKDDSISLAFDPSKDPIDISTDFKVVRVKQFENDMEDLFFSFEIYSSATEAWKISKETCQCNDNLYKNKGIFIGGILHWLTDGEKILTFNLENELALLILVPIPASEFKSIPEACIGESEGRLQYVIVSEEGLQVWFLEDYFEFKWELKYSKSLVVMEQEYSQLCNLTERVQTRVGIHMNPWMDPLAFKDGVLLMRVSIKIYLCHIETGKMEEVCTLTKLGSSSMYSPIVLPYTLSLVPLNHA